jgi:hypothetical protein
MSRPEILSAHILAGSLHQQGHHPSIRRRALPLSGQFRASPAGAAAQGSDGLGQRHAR